MQKKQMYFIILGRRGNIMLQVSNQHQICVNISPKN